MKQDQTFFFYPGGESGGAPDPKTTLEESDGTEKKIPSTGEEEDQTLGEKIKEALQDWSNKDQADQDFDDTRV